MYIAIPTSIMLTISAAAIHENDQQLTERYTLYNSYCSIIIINEEIVYAVFVSYLHQYHCYNYICGNNHSLLIIIIISIIIIILYQLLTINTTSIYGYAYILVVLNDSSSSSLLSSAIIVTPSINVIIIHHRLQ
jgi:hypothetical protein